MKLSTILVAVLFCHMAVAGEQPQFEIEKDDLGSGDVMRLRIYSSDNSSALLVACSSGGAIQTVLVAPRNTFFPTDVNFDKGTMSHEVRYKFDTDADGTNDVWHAPIGEYSMAYKYDRSVVERLGTANSFVIVIAKTSSKFTIPLRGTAAGISKMLKGCK